MPLWIKQKVLSDESYPGIKSVKVGPRRRPRGTGMNVHAFHNTHIWFDIAMYEAQFVATFDGEHHLYYCGVDVDTRFVES